ncbi:FadR family transcriptional regulator [Agrobacterium rubi]|uniref:FadR family transcriptional regulator n=1 Tax=Agrobacterium rubi TaxID=28099 RepID=A0AAE7R1W0_9HYPH|nr:FadR family transcriptional regulator [Agrobacterium rubi]NTF01075.1 FadR family transcriptional regulator [Agrobacterium rubi]NTF35263.1 FadR family transcriptional regulator [Agrobacterium rubi]QTG00465.1 FadR family transcriptional regulator [Agrobacterium rubi]
MPACEVSPIASERILASLNETVDGGAKEKSSSGRSGGSLVSQTADALRQTILSGQYKPGDKLPSEAGLTELYKVSRTVVREAVAALRADKLVEARHGAGIFVLALPTQQPQPFQDVDHDRISSIIELLELRAAVETEAAELAAVRRSPAQEEAIIRCLSSVQACIDAGSPTAEADFKLHLAIADATNNPRFREFLEVMGQNVIPRAALRASQSEKAAAPYLQQLQNEHDTIVHAISDGDAVAAREAMRQHLKGSQQRYRAMLRQGDR